MAGTTRLELATSAVTGGLSTAGVRKICRLHVRLSAAVGAVGQARDAFVQRFVQLRLATFGQRTIATNVIKALVRLRDLSGTRQMPTPLLSSRCLSYGGP